MTRLLRAEIRRVAARRLVRMTILLTAIAIVVGGVLAFATTKSLSETTYRQRERVAEAQRHAQDERAKACLQAHGVQVGDDFSRAVGQECLPDKSISAHDPRFHRERLRDLLKGVSGVVAIVGWALGAALVGAEFASRSMTTMLTWETRRMRVIATKIAVAFGTVVLYAIATLGALALALLPAMTLHGAPLQAGDPSLLSIAGVVARGALLAGLASGMGFAIATLGRNTAAALGAGFAYIVVLENILGNSLRQWRRWLLLGNAIVLVSGSSSGSDVPGRSVIGAGVFLAAVTATLLVGAAAAFRSRDLA
jgi:ABC-2 type transport system permease protein